ATGCRVRYHEEASSGRSEKRIPGRFSVVRMQLTAVTHDAGRSKPPPAFGPDQTRAGNACRRTGRTYPVDIYSMRYDGPETIAHLSPIVALLRALLAQGGAECPHRTRSSRAQGSNRLTPGHSPSA